MVRDPLSGTLRLCVLALGGLVAARSVAAATVFKHIVIVVQENRTPDNMFGSNPKFEPGVDIATSGVNSMGKTIPLTAVALTACYDIRHTHEGFAISLRQGFDRAVVGGLKGCVVPPNPQFKYIDNTTGTVQPYFDIATNYGFANRMFQTNQGPSFPAHQFLFGGTSAPAPLSARFAAENPGNTLREAGCTAPTTQSVRVIDSFGSELTHARIYPCFDHPALSDLLDAAKPAISWRYYSSMPGSIWNAPNALRHICVPVPAGNEFTCTGPAWKNGSVVSNNSAQVLTDIKACKLQSVSWVIPSGRQSDHAQINNGTGPQWVASIVNAVGTQKICPHNESYWNDTAILITWDDWGGWFDHVPPFKVNVQTVTPPSKPEWGDGYTYGFRVPLLVVSAYTPPGFVDNAISDFGSILYFVESNFGLGFIGPGTTQYGRYADYHAQTRGNLSEFFTLKSPRPFKTIPATITAQDFIDMPPSAVPPDND